MKNIPAYKKLKSTDNLNNIKIRMQTDVDIETIKEFKEKILVKEFNNIKKDIK